MSAAIIGRLGAAELPGWHALPVSAARVSAAGNATRADLLLHELDGLFVEPDQMAAGVGRALVEDAAARCAAISDAEAVLLKHADHMLLRRSAATR
jgi:GNAT superfamily N-acetyltransferase